MHKNNVKISEIRTEDRVDEAKIPELVTFFESVLDNKETMEKLVNETESKNMCDSSPTTRFYRQD